MHCAQTRRTHVLETFRIDYQNTDRNNIDLLALRMHDWIAVEFFSLGTIDTFPLKILIMIL